MTRVNLALAALVALLVLVVLFAPDPERDLPPEPGPLTGLNPESLQEIRIHRNPGQTLVFRREHGRWRMTAPFAISAHQDRLQALSRIAATPSHRSFPADQANLAELGLTPAPLGLQLNGLTLEIGGTEPIRRRRYVLLDGHVHLIDDLFQHHLLAAAADLVDFHPFSGTLHSATLDGVKAGPETLGRLGRSRARKVERADQGIPGLALEVQREGEAPIRFRLSDDGLQLWREQPPLLYHLAMPLIDVETGASTIERK